MNSMSEMSWERDGLTIAEALNLKGGTQEKKGPCPICGGTDRFWIRRGRDLPIIFGCRQGCGFSDLMREFENRGLVQADKWIPPKYKKDDLVMADNIIMIVTSDLDSGSTFDADDYLLVGHYMTKVDEERRLLLSALLDRMKGI